MEGEPTIPDTPASSTSTIPDEPPESWTRWERRLHVASFVLVVGLVILAATGLLGVRTGTITASEGGYQIEVLRTAVSRPGLATPFGISVATADGSDLPETVTLRVDSSYLAMFDFNGLQPEPSTTFSTEQWTWWTFDVPRGHSSLRVELDARLEPSVQWARAGTAGLEINGDSLVSVDFTTWVMP